MKTLITILTVLTFISCTDRNERPFQTRASRFKNTANQDLEIKGYNSQNVLVFEDLLANNQISEECIAHSELFLGIACKIDSIVFKFSNNKGYICAARITNTTPELCFPNNKSPLGHDPFNPSFINLGNNIYEFEVTQDDFDNAFVLP